VLCGLAVASTLGAGCVTTKNRGSIATSAAIEAIRDENPGEDLLVEAPAAARAGALGGAAQPPAPLVTLIEVNERSAKLALSSGAAASIVPTESLRRVVVIRRGQGAMVGGAVGITLGVAAALIAAATYSDPCAHSTSFGCVEVSRGDRALLAGLVTGIPVSLIGAGLGAVTGLRTEYVFREAAPNAGKSAAGESHRVSHVTSTTAAAISSSASPSALRATR
jgi:hypothetical protein